MLLSFVKTAPVAGLPSNGGSNQSPSGYGRSYGQNYGN